MGEIVNLRQVRKAKMRAAAVETAAARRARFGRTRVEILSDEAERARAARVLDGALLGSEVVDAVLLPPPPTPSPEEEGA